MNSQNCIASIFEYSKESIKKSNIKVFEQSYDGCKGIFGIIGSGNFASSTIVPSMVAAYANIKYIASSKGLSAKMLAKKGRIANATSDYKKILNDADVDAVIISTRHNLHASMIYKVIN